MENVMNIDKIKSLFPNEWVLIGNPVLDEYKINVLSGVPVYHSIDKKEVCYLGRDKTDGYSKIKLIYTGSITHGRVLTGIFNRVK
jgi:hypothetical protein